MRVLPTICVHMCSVSQVSRQWSNGSSGHISERQRNLIDVAPAPILAGLGGTYYGVFGGVEMLGRVLVFGRIAAAHMTADHAQPQVDPGVADFQALLAPAGMRVHIADLIHVRAAFHSPQ